MAHWIAYDDATAAALGMRTHATVEVGVGDPLDALLAAPGDAMALFPAGEGTTTVLTLRRRGAPGPARARVATGFLGLMDEEVEEEPQGSRKWWHRIWE
jgi:hypothetical protein